MKKITIKSFRCFALLATFLATGSVDAAPIQNARVATDSNVAPARAMGRDVKRAESDSVARSAAQRSTTSSRAAVSARSGAAGTVRNTRNTTTVSRSAMPARSARSAVVPTRSATTTNKSNVSRAASSRATAVFEDMSKIGGGYAQCRESYSTCMDQFCAKANDTYRRCFCSNRFEDFRDTEDALDQAKILLQRFEDNNLNAIDKTAAEIDAMYSATIGEAAIKNDVSASSKALEEIGNLLSGKKKSTSSATQTSTTIDYSLDTDNIWDSSSNDNSIFGGNNGVDLTTLEGGELFNYVHKQCSELAAESCQSSAVANMAKSAYGIMINQDCNAYERSIDAKRQQVQNAVRQAEKYLREARLEEYRAHNSQDVNECLDKVRTAMLADTACGADYKRCLDPTGAFISQSTGEPIYTARLFQLADLIKLDGEDLDVLGQNTAFATFLDERKMFATTALDSCRDISDLVWTEFKRAALIEISQAQEEKLEEVRMSCVSTMKECYDTQSGALKNFDDTTAKTAGALSAYAAKAICQDKVVACAALYGSSAENAECQFDGSGRITNGARCGLTALLSFVDTVDNTRVAEACETAVEKYAKDLCTPTSGEMGYPWKCRNKNIGEFNSIDDKTISASSSLSDIISKYAYDNCKDPVSGTVLPTVTTKVSMLIEDLRESLTDQLADSCEQLTGIWYSSDTPGYDGFTTWLPAFTSTLFNGQIPDQDDLGGICVENTAYVQCISSNTEGETPVATWNASSQTCTLSDAWYQERCSMLGGYFENSVCYIAK